MHLTTLHYLFLIPVGLALAFMAWVLWSVTGQLAKGGTPPEKQQPMISIRVRDRYSLETQTPPTRSVQIAPPVAPSPGPPPGQHGLSNTREFAYVPPAPTLGMGFRAASSSTGRAARK